MRDLEIAVVGAGVIGVTTALEIQEKLPSAKIALLDDRFNDTTLSYSPAGIFRPSPQFGGKPVDVVKTIIGNAFAFYNELLHVENSGIIEKSGFIFSDTNKHVTKNAFLESIVPVYREATEDERTLYSKSWKYGAYFETLMITCSRFLPWALNRFQTRGGITRKQKVNSFADLENEFNVVFNCTGFGAKYLCNDAHVVPIRGQIIKIYAPWIKHFYYNEYDTYILPTINNLVTLGGTRNYESYETSVNPYDSMSIKKRCSDILPKIADAKIVTEWVGLRPHRHILRTDLENVGKLKVIHNYGHGGYGITTAPGTAAYVVQEFQKSHLCNSKL